MTDFPEAPCPRVSIIVYSPTTRPAAAAIVAFVLESALLAAAAGIVVFVLESALLAAAAAIFVLLQVLAAPTVLQQSGLLAAV